MLSFMNINSKERENYANSTLTRMRERSPKMSDLYVLSWKSSCDVNEVAKGYSNATVCPSVTSL